MQTGRFSTSMLHAWLGSWPTLERIDTTQGLCMFSVCDLTHVVFPWSSILIMYVCV